MTRRRLAPGFLAVAAALVHVAAGTAPQTPPTFPAEAELVRIDVVVLDGEGRPVTGLSAGDFEVTEAGRPHEIASFEPIVVRATPIAAASADPAPDPRVSEPLASAPAENRSFLIFFDDVHLSAQSAERVRAQLAPWLEREGRDGDWITIVSPAGVRWTARTAFERKQLAGVVRSLKGGLVRNPMRDGITEYDAMRMEEYGGRLTDPQSQSSRGIGSVYSGNPRQTAQEKYLLAKRRVRQTLGALAQAIESLAGFRGRKSLLFYSEGFIKSPSMPDYDRVIELARRAHVAVYFVQPRVLPRSEPGEDDSGANPLIEIDTLAAGTSYIASATGGRTSISNDVTALLKEAAVESSAYYLIGFQPAPGRPGERKLKVRVRRDGLTVRAPDRYVAGEPENTKAAPPAVQAVGLVSDATAVPLKFGTLFLFEASPDGEVATTFAVEVDAAGERTERRLDLLVEARPLGTGPGLRDSAELKVAPGGPAVATRELRLSPGLWQARAVVRDRRTGQLGSALHTFEVPSGSGLRVSSPILTDALEPGGVPRPRLRLTRRYRSGTAFYCQYRVFGAALDPAARAPRVTASYAIHRAGVVVQSGPPTTIEPTGDGQLLRLIGFGLTGFEPGEYTLALQVSDEVSGETREVSERFSVVLVSGG